MGESILYDHRNQPLPPTDMLPLEYVEKADRSLVAFVSPWAAQYGVVAPETFYIKDFLQTYGDGTINSVWVYAAVRTLAQTCQQIPISLFTKKGRKLGDMVDDNPILDFLERPNPTQTYADFIEAGISYFSLGGNFFIGLEGMDDPEDLTSTPKEMWALRPDKMRIVPEVFDKEKYGTIKLYAVEAGANLDNWPKYSPNEILHIKAFSPTNSYWGLPPLSVARLTILHDTYSREFMTNFFRNGLQTSGVLTTDFKLNEDSFARMNQQWRELNTGTRNMHKPLILENGLKWTQTTMPPQDAQFMQLREMNKSEIIGGVFGLPPAAVGDFKEASVLANAGVQDKVKWEVAVGVMERVTRVMDEYLLPRFGLDPKKFQLTLDLSDIGALREDEFKKAQTFKTLVDAGFSKKAALHRLYPDEKENAVEVEEPMPAEEDAGEEGASDQRATGEETVPNNGKKAGENFGRALPQEIGKIIRRRGKKWQLLSGKGRVLGTHSSKEDAKKQELAIQLEKLRAQGRIPARKTLGEDVDTAGGFLVQPGKKKRRKKSEAEVRLAKSFLDDMEYLEHQFAKLMKPAFKSWARRVSKAISRKLASALKKVRKAEDDDREFAALTAGVLDAVDWQDEEAALRDALGPVYEEIAEIAVEFANDAVEAAGGIGVSFDLVSPRVLRKMDDLGLELAKSVTGTVKEDVRDALIEGLSEGESIPQLAKRLRDIVEGYQGEGEAYRATRVARTEAIRASNSAADEVYKEAGVMKIWLDTKDSREDELCFQLAAMDPIPAGAEFMPGIAYPPAHVQCRCALAAHIEL